MPSVKNPNGPSKNRQAARAAKVRKLNQKKSAAGKTRISKADSTRGAREGILPTSGPNAALSGKKRRKMERRLGHALRRKMEAEGEVEMKDASEETSKTSKSEKAAASQDVDMEADNIA
ncbi:hypothetical protein BX600DRAFT_88139 [Xylariales sp. PMI_506]|nr:hypothetical protein BX600DRAFT_88139 [Xylariales sp. PMI_506]